MPSAYARARRRRAIAIRSVTLGMLVATRIAWGWAAPPPRVPSVIRLEVQSAPAWELTLLPGVGWARAYELLRLRAVVPLRAARDLTAVRGIGARRAAAIGRTQEVRVTWAKSKR